MDWIRIACCIGFMISDMTATFLKNNLFKQYIDIQYIEASVKQ